VGFEVSSQCLCFIVLVSLSNAAAKSLSDSLAKQNVCILAKFSGEGGFARSA
jgi:hypothetical protein